MRRVHLARAVLVVGALALVAGACRDDDGGDDESTTTTEAAAAADRGNVDGELKLGAMVPQTGDLNTIVESLQEPINIAIQEINEHGRRARQAGGPGRG